MTDRKGKYVSIEQPDQQIDVDFLSFNTGNVHVPGCTVKLSVSYDKHTGKATLYVSATDDGGNQPILIDQACELVTQDRECEDEEEECEDCGPAD